MPTIPQRDRDLFENLFALELANNPWGRFERGLKIIRDHAAIVRYNNAQAAIKLQYRDVDAPSGCWATTWCATIPPMPTATASATSAAAPCWGMAARLPAPFGKRRSKTTFPNVTSLSGALTPY